MASGPVGEGGGARERKRFDESKVYRRKVFKGPRKNPNVENTVASSTAAVKDDSAATTAVTNDTDINNNSTVKNSCTDEAKSNIDNVLVQPPAPQLGELGDGNLAQPEGSSRLEGENTALPLDSSRLEDGNSPLSQATSRLEDGNSPQQQLEDQNKAQPQVSSRTEDGISPQRQLEDQNLAQPLVSSRTEDGISPQRQLEDQNLAQPLVSSRTEDGISPQRQLEDQNLAQPQVSSRTEDGISPQRQLVDQNLAQPQVSSRTEDGISPQRQLEDQNLDQPLVSSRTEDGNSPQQQLVDQNLAQPQVSSRTEDGISPQRQLEDQNKAQPQVSSRTEDGISPQLVDQNLAQAQVSSRTEEGDSPRPQVDSRTEDGNSPQPQVNSRPEDGNSPQLEVNSRPEESTSQQQDSSTLEVGNSSQPQVKLRLEEGNLPQPLVSSRLEDGNLAPQLAQPVFDDSHSHQLDEPSNLNIQQGDDGPSNPSHRQGAVPSIRDLPSVNGTVELQLEDRIKINLASKSKQEKQELRWKFESELDVVRSLVKRIEVKQGQVGGYGNSNVLVGSRFTNGSGAKRAHSEVASAGVPRQPTRPLHQLSLPMLENSRGISESVEKEKRMPKANQFYHNSEFLLAKDKFPPPESNKKSKLNWKRQSGGEMGQGLQMGSKFFKSCSSLLEKLMKHKHGWVFNSPVDVEGLGLHDYFTIITHPMDLGTVKTRLNKNWYKSPKEFAEDVRLTFHNAMTYNPKGQDVHVMAEQLSKIFEDRWAIIESDYNREMRYGIDYGAAPPAPSPLSRKVPAFTPPALDMRRILDRSESLARTPRSMSITPSSRTPAPKKPKAKDPHKRDMTFEEKQKLSTNLQSLPPEKLDAIVQIIKRRNLALDQHDDEIEVDIDSVDAETLWELDRFVTNYKKSLSKNKRKAELARARAEALQNAIQKNQAPAMVEIPKETQADERNVAPSLPMQGGNQADNRSRSSSSSSSSSDSGSSSSDSDSDSSSASGSDAGSQGT